MKRIREWLQNHEDDLFSAGCMLALLMLATLVDENRRLREENSAYSLDWELRELVGDAEDD